MRLILLTLGLLTTSVGAWAQTPSNAQVVTSCGSPNSTYPVGSMRPITVDPSGGLCGSGSGPGGTPTPVIPGYSAPVAPGQYGLAVTASTALTVPAGAKVALVTVEGTSVRFTDDGTTVTPTVGQGPFVAGVPPLVFYGADMAAVRFIQTSATATINVTYYKQ